MYSRPQGRDLHVPINYGGSIFNSRPAPSTPVEDLTRHRPAPPVPEPPVQESESAQEAPPCPPPAEHPKPPSPLSLFGSLGTEELLLLALALIVFQGGKEPELGLILLALLFIN